MVVNKIYVRSLLPLAKLTNNKTVKMIKEWIPNKPLKPSIRLDPLIINKKHKHIKNKAKISIARRLFKNAKPVFSI